MSRSRGKAAIMEAIGRAIPPRFYLMAQAILQSRRTAAQLKNSRIAYKTVQRQYMKMEKPERRTQVIV